MRYALFFLFLTFYILSPVHTMADEKKEIPPVQNGWEKEADGNRSLFSSPSLFIEQVSENVYCRVSFELKHKTTSGTIGFSKYFRVNAIKGSHSHVDTYFD